MRSVEFVATRVAHLKVPLRWPITDWTFRREWPGTIFPADHSWLVYTDTDTDIDVDTVDVHGSRALNDALGAIDGVATVIWA